MHTIPKSNLTKTLETTVRGTLTLSILYESLVIASQLSTENDDILQKLMGSGIASLMGAALVREIAGPMSEVIVDISTKIASKASDLILDGVSRISDTASHGATALANSARDTIAVATHASESLVEGVHDALEAVSDYYHGANNSDSDEETPTTRSYESDTSSGDAERLSDIGLYRTSSTESTTVDELSITKDSTEAAASASALPRPS